jgi:hypothetical protein
LLLVSGQKVVQAPNEQKISRIHKEIISLVLRVSLHYCSVNLKLSSPVL